jgi:hypothetical protein
VISSLLLLACSGTSPTSNPPVVDSVDTTCDAGVLDFRIVASDDVAVTNTSVGDLLPTWVSGETVSVWTLELDHDCDAPWADDLLLSNAVGLTATERLMWPVDPPEGLQLSQPYGTAAGGTELSITGTGLGPVDTVLFGDEPATVLSTSDTEVVVVTPAGDEGAVTVSVHMGELSADVAEDFVYYADGTGLWGGIARPWLYIYDVSQFTIGSAYGAIAYGPFFQVDTVWHRPVDIEQSFLGNAPAVGECGWTSNYAWESYDAGSYVLADDLALVPTATYVYHSVQELIDPADYAGQSWDVEIPGGELPAMVLQDAMVFPQELSGADFDWTAANTRTWGEDLVLSWDATDADGVRIGVHASRGSTSLGSWECSYEPGTGVTLPWDEIVAGVDASQVNALHLTIGFYKDTYTVMPHDNSTYWSQSELMYWVHFPLSAP